jgi:uncharacterized protein (DUF885 family)
MWPVKGLWLVPVLVIVLPVAARADDLAAIVRDFDAHVRIEDPVRAGQRGDRDALRRWPDNSPRAVTARRDRLLRFRERLNAFESPGLSETDALNRALLVDRVDVALAGLAFDEERIPFISGDGFYTTADYAALGTSLASDDDAEAWLARLAAIPSYYATETANMERGIRTRFTQPRGTVERAIHDVRTQAEQPSAQSPLLAPFDTLPVAFPAQRRAGLRSRALDAIETRVKPAQRELLRFLEQEYLPAARRSIGASSLPDGEAYYAFLVRRHTTTTMTPTEVHALGVAEVARIRAAMNAVIAESGFKGTFAEFLAFLRSDPRFYVDSTRYGEKASEIAKRADEAVARIVGRLPRLTYGVRPIPAGLESSANGYLPGSPEQGIAGMVVFKPWMAEKMPTFGLAAWVLHEGVPGHHLQIALSQEMTELPEFRRADDITAYVEGWGLYAEKLGEDMGIYRDPYERFGRLSLEMWRACRLVIDTGMHAMGWSREQAVACLRENSALAATEIEFEVDRYIAWPAQALAYKVGEQRLLALRRRGESRLGAQFDLRRFHDRVLGQGAMPLAVLETEVERWIEAGGRRAAEQPSVVGGRTGPLEFPAVAGVVQW